MRNAYNGMMKVSKEESNKNLYRTPRGFNKEV